MSENGKSNGTVIRTERGLTVGGSRLTIYQLMDHFKAGDPDELVQEWYRLTADQVADIHRYIAEHEADVEAEYQEVLRHAQEQQRYWNEQNRDRFEEIRSKPPTPEQAVRLAKLEEMKRHRGRT